LKRAVGLTRIAVKEGEANPQQEDDGRREGDAASDTDYGSAAVLYGCLPVQFVLQVGEVLPEVGVLHKSLHGIGKEGVVEGCLLEVVHFMGR
jgi:hypothetical protein